MTKPKTFPGSLPLVIVRDLISIMALYDYTQHENVVGYAHSNAFLL